MKTKAVGGKQLLASDFAYVGNAEDTSTWHLPMADEAQVREALARFDQAQIPADAKAAVVRTLVIACKKYGIDCSGFDGEGDAKSSQSVAIIGIRCEARIEAGVDDGTSWPIQVMQAGFARGEVMTDDPRFANLPHYFPKEVVAQVAEACNNARFGRRHPSTETEEFDPARIAGYLDSGKMEGDTARATMHFFDSEKDLQAKLSDAKKAGKLDLFGVSILGYFSWKKAKAEGKDALVAQKLGRLVSVDMVTEAGAGGKFLGYAASLKREVEAAQLAADQEATAAAAKKEEEVIAAKAAEKVSAGEQAGEKSKSSQIRPGTARGEGASMKDSILKVLEALRKIDAGRADELKTEFESVADELQPQLEFFAKVTQAVSEKMPLALVSDQSTAKQIAEMLLQASESVRNKQSAEVLAKTTQALDEAKKINFSSTLERKLNESKLPMPAQSLVREHFSGAVADDKAVDSFIAKTRESFAGMSQIGRVGGSTIEVGRNSLDKLRLAMDATLGVKEALADKSVKPFTGIRQAFLIITGQAELGPRFDFYSKASEAIATGDFPNILLDSMNKRLIQDYRALGMRGPFGGGSILDLLTEGPALMDYKTQNRVRMGYYGDLPTVAEAGPYTELTKPTDEKISYAALKKGGIQTISEETIANDDLGKILQIPSRLARAGVRTLKQFVTDFFINASNFDPDSVAWFHATHTNLGSIALSSAELDARSIALAKQTEKDSSKKLGLPLQWIMVPIDLWPTARQINHNDSGTNNYFNYFGENDERIIVNELLTDVNDWYFGSTPDVAPFFEIAYLYGQKEPQIYIANLPTQGTQFTNDQMQLKAKFGFGGDIIDFRPVGKNVV